MLSCLRWIFLVLVVLLWSGCQAPSQDTQRAGSEGLTIPSINSSLGGTPEEGAYTYTLTLSNGTNQEITIDSITPVVTPALSQRVDAGQLQLMVGQRVAPGGAIQVSGTIHFKALDLSKQQISDLMPLVTNFRVISEQSLPVPSQS